MCALFYLELGRGLSPTESALIFSPLGLLAGFFAPTVGRLVDRLHPRYVPAFGFAVITFGLIWLIAIMPGRHPLWELTLPIAVMGVGSSCIWTSIAAIATHDLPVHRAGAGSGIYNTTRQVASVLGSGAISALITARMAAERLPAHLREDAAAGRLPAAVQESVRTALAQSMLLPLVLMLIGLLASALLVEHKRKDVAALGDSSARSVEDLAAHL
jgi:MFS family permease